MAVKIEEQSSKIVKPLVSTLPTLRHYKLGFIEEVVAFVNVGVVLFFTPSSEHNAKFVSQLEKSLKRTLTQFYPLAGRYVQESHIIECNDEGVEFICAKVNTTLQDFLSYKENDKIIDDFIPCNEFLLATQVTMFECGAVAIGVSATHMLCDASTLCTFINEWGVMNRGESQTEFTGAGFSSSSLYQTRGLCPIPKMSSDMLTKFTRKKVSISESVISQIKAKGKNSTRKWSKVQLVAAIFWKAFIDIDRKIYNYQRESVLIQSINLRGKMASLIPKDSCGNIFGMFATEAGVAETTEALTDLLSDSVRKTVTNYSKAYHNNEEGETMVFNSFSQLLNINPESTNAVILTSWCKFPFYEADFGFGKPIWAAPGTIPVKNSAYFMDYAEGNGVESYVFLETKDVPFFEEAFYRVINDFAV
uniref:pelargonidin 3-O-(6-caffeoylglucoside) 5-O-(6-O-malonylglucoside) 4'''-malonyltransferase-like n=1 Tax=Erigeron canadensis TaxID=72917 RepID=UPI001CB9629F|nr:pelargonidin 3-O-(6-caffeoylglucoside) 5-O-(6-O-malonylglucoside) 4'''-malonyltransferase-like [Erigeron canadensis]